MGEPEKINLNKYFNIALLLGLISFITYYFYTNIEEKRLLKSLLHTDLNEIKVIKAGDPKDAINCDVKKIYVIQDIFSNSIKFWNLFSSFAVKYHIRIKQKNGNIFRFTVYEGGYLRVDNNYYKILNNLNLDLFYQDLIAPARHQ